MRAPRTRGIVAAWLLLVAAVAMVVVPAPRAGAQLEPPPPEPLPRAYVLADADTGEVLAAHNEHETLLVASTIKLLTALTALEHVPSDTVLTVSQRAADAPAYDMGMVEGEQWRLLDAISAMLIVSANDAAYAVAEASAGTVEDFSDQMTATAERLGTVDSTFRDPSGLDNDNVSIGGSMVSAWDLAVIGRNALAVPAIAERAARERDSFVDLNGDTRTLPSRNNVFLTMYEGATGLKTGGTEAAGSNLVASATRDGRTLVAVVLGIPSTVQWAATLLDRGFAGEATPTGESLPDVDVALADTTRDALAGSAAVLGRGAFTFDGEVPEETEDDNAAESAAPAPTDSAPPPADTSSGDTGGLSWIWFVVAAVVIAAVLVVLRRRAVKRRRTRRAERQRALAEARRRGMIDVIEPGAQSSSSVQVKRRSD